MARIQAGVISKGLISGSMLVCERLQPETLSPTPETWTWTCQAHDRVYGSRPRNDLQGSLPRGLGVSISGLRVLEFWISSYDLEISC